MLYGSGYFLAGWVRRGPPARIAQDSLSPVRGPLPNDMLGSVTLDLDPVDRGHSTVGGGYFLAGWVRRGPPARVAQGGLVIQAGIDYGMPEFVRRPRFMFRTLSVEPIIVHSCFS
ncbi:hypothetical protein M9H77_16571 [Catharanthus roseus]|uniref:Uncharacterized protein n=1 Tax=Catharanthus roseus TaxID=4058 RepID=A0ACC0B251_CATRO|nr:hypothetical protein M9H77_16571 [Catharanthus roseus]